MIKCRRAACRRARGTRRRGLCDRCHSDPLIRQYYPTYERLPVTELQKRLKEAKEENALAERHARQLGERTPESRQRIRETIDRLLAGTEATPEAAA